MIVEQSDTYERTRLLRRSKTYGRRRKQNSRGDELPRTKTADHQLREHGLTALLHKRPAAGSISGPLKSHWHHAKQPSAADRLRTDYQVTHMLGRGGCGLVVHAVRRKDNREVAIKIVPKDELNLSMNPAFATELAVLRGLDSDRIVRLLDVFEDGAEGYEVLEYVRGQTLLREMHKRGGQFSEHDALLVTEGVLDALAYLHKRRIAHLDIKLDNIMLESSDPARAKLIDFDLALMVKDVSAAHRSSQFQGTPRYSAPEVILNRTTIPEKVDMWGLGLVLYALIDGNLPFHGSKWSQLQAAIASEPVLMEGAHWEAVSERTKELVLALLSKDQRRRPTAVHALRFVRDILSSTDGAMRRMTTGLHAVSLEPEERRPDHRRLRRLMDFFYPTVNGSEAPTDTAASEVPLFCRGGGSEAFLQGSVRNEDQEDDTAASAVPPFCGGESSEAMLLGSVRNGDREED